MFNYVKQLYEIVNDRLNIGLDAQVKELQSKYKDALEAIKEYVKDYKRTFFIKITDYISPLGMTDCKGMIWMRRLPGYLRDKVLKHEILHNLFPNLSEYEIVSLTYSFILDFVRLFLVYI